MAGKNKNSGNDWTQLTTGDAAHAIARAGLSAIPLIGGPAVELMNTIFASPIAKRRDEFIESVADGLRRLEERGRLDMASLQHNEEFISATAHAMVIAIRAHQVEKRRMLRNGVLNAALRIDIDADLQLVFSNLLDTLTPSHLGILDLMRREGSLDQRTWKARVLEAFPGLERNDLYRLLRKDLERHHLVAVHEQISHDEIRVPTEPVLGGLVKNGDGTPMMNYRTVRGEPTITSTWYYLTPLALEFLSFVASPLDEEPPEPTRGA